MIDFKHSNITDFICLAKWGKAVPESVSYLMCLAVSMCLAMFLDGESKISVIPVCECVVLKRTSCN